MVSEDRIRIEPYDRSDRDDLDPPPPGDGASSWTWAAVMVVGKKAETKSTPASAARDQPSHTEVVGKIEEM